MKKLFVTFLIALTLVVFGAPSFVGAAGTTAADFKSKFGRDAIPTELTRWQADPSKYEAAFTTLHNFIVKKTGKTDIWPTPASVALYQDTNLLSPQYPDLKMKSSAAQAFYNSFGKFPEDADQFSLFREDPEKYVKNYNNLVTKNSDGTYNNPTPAAVAAATRADSTCSGVAFLKTQCLMEFVYSIIDSIGNAVLSVAAWILWACGTLFNFSIISFVIQMKTRITNIGAIYVVWQTVRDLANMFFIFILLYIAIKTILGDSSYKKTLINVVLVALFINFSFFATGLMIDASNITALQFYNGFAGSNCGQSTNKSNALDPNNAMDGCMSQTVVSAMKLGSIYDAKTSNTIAGNNSKVNVQGAVLSSSQGIGAFLVTVIMGSALMVITGGIFLASAILIIGRFIELIFLLMFSPLAFAMIILPGMNGYWKEWSGRLSKQLIFAPVYFMFLWVTMKVIQSGALRSTNTFTDGFQGDATALFGLVSGFIIVIAMLIYSLTLAKKLGATGSGLATSVSKGFTGFIRNNTVGFLGKNTIGKAAYSMANSNAMRNLSASHPTIGRIVSRPLGTLSKQDFGTGTGYDKAMEKRKKMLVDQGKFVGETGLLVQGKNESDKDYDVRKKEAEAAGRARKVKYANIVGGNETYDKATGKRTTPWSVKASNFLRIKAALRSNKEAANEMKKQIVKDTKEGISGTERKAQLKKAVEDMHETQKLMGYKVPDLKGELPEIKHVTLETQDQDDAISERDDADLAQIEADIGALDKVTQKDDVAKKLVEKKKIENRRKKFENLRNKINNIQDKLERDNETDKITAAMKTGGGTPPPPAPPKP